MRTIRLMSAAVLLFSILLLDAAAATAQHWSFDARRIGVGGARPGTSIASSMVPRRRTYRSIVLPFRLLQVLGDMDVYNPHSIDFDPIRAVTNIVSPLHFTFGEPAPGDYSALLNDLLNFGLDIESYFAELGIDIDELEALLAQENGTASRAVGSLPATATIGDLGKHAVPAAVPGVPMTTTGPTDTGDGMDPFAGFQIDLQRWDWDTSYLAEFMFTRNWGRTFQVHEGSNGINHAVYVGAGPYVSLHSDAAVAAGAGTYIGVGSIIRSIEEGQVLPDVAGARMNFEIGNHTYSQLAATIVGGYRVRLPLPGRAASARNGIYVATNYHYLHGFAYENVGLDLDLVADSADLFSTDYNPASVSVGQIERLTSRSGRGFALDIGVAVAIDRWDFGFGATGLMNRINWRGVQRGVLPLAENNLYEGFAAGVLDDIQEPESLDPDRRVSTPRRYTADAGYHSRSWSVLANYSRGFGGNYMHTGLEYRLPWVELRGGSVLNRDRWHPTGGFGFELSPGWHLDVAAFGTSINPQRERRLGMAVSLRLE